MAYATATYITLALLAASTGTAIYGQQQAKESAKEAAAYNARQANAEARNLELQERERQARARIAHRRERARARVALANSGTLTTSGTPLAVLGDLAATRDLELQDSLRSTALQAQSIRSGASMGLWEAKQKAAAADIASIGTALSGASKSFSAYDDAVYTGQANDTFGLYRTKRSP